jgi:acetyl-CoA carboxylase beta subunit
MLTTKEESDKIRNAIHESLWSKCDKCNGEYLDEDLKSYSDWSLCATCEDNINYIILHNINPCSTCVIRGKKA